MGGAILIIESLCDRMTFIAAKWTIDEYHRMIAAEILRDRKVELLKGEIVDRVPRRRTTRLL